MIVLAEIKDLPEIFELYAAVRKKMWADGFYNWYEGYPPENVIKEAVHSQTVYKYVENSEIIGVATFDEIQHPTYKAIKWLTQDSKHLAVHRIGVHPKYQKQGYALKLMQFAEELAKDMGCVSIRLDALGSNERLVDFYKRQGYIYTGFVNFENKEGDFFTFEKVLP